MRKKVVVIGVTGSLGTGKTLVAGFFKDLGAAVLDADKIAHGALSPKAGTYKRILKIFGSQILKKGGSVDRRLLGKIVFDNKALLKKLCDIIHPYVIKIINREIRRIKREARRPAIILDIPLLVEANLMGLIDFLIVVKIGRKQQIERCRKETELSAKEISARIGAQMSLAKKARFADFLIDNSKTEKQTKGEVKKIWAEIQQQTVRKKRI